MTDSQQLRIQMLIDSCRHDERDLLEDHWIDELAGALQQAEARSTMQISREWDEYIQKGLQHVAIPNDLSSRILAQTQQTLASPETKRIPNLRLAKRTRRMWLGALLGSLACAVLWGMLKPHTAQKPWTAEELTDRTQAWLANHALVDQVWHQADSRKHALPPAMRGRSTKWSPLPGELFSGCPAFLHALESGASPCVLFVIETGPQTGLRDSPAGKPTDSYGEWSIWAWSQGGQSYLFCARAEPQRARQQLDRWFPQRFVIHSRRQDTARFERRS